MPTARAPIPDPKRDASKKPSTLAPRPEEVPLDLTELASWVRWRWFWDSTRSAWTKAPVSATGSRFASTADPSTWGSFEIAVSNLGRDHVDGIGFVFSASDPFCGVDLDACRDPETETISDAALEIAELLDGYAELSVTGTGIHVIVRASLGDVGGKKSSFIEVYDRKRYFAMSGHRLPIRRIPS